MSLTVALSISIGVVSGLWMIIAHYLGLTGLTFFIVPAWAAFVGMPLYFASGGGKKGLSKTLAANAGGALMSIVMLLIADFFGFLGGPFDIALGVGLGSLIIVCYSKFDLLSYVPGGFGGCASAFGFGAGKNFPMVAAVIIALFSGAILGYIADVWGNAMAKKSGEEIG